MNVIYRLAGGAYSFTGNTTAFVEMEDGINEQGLAVGLTSVYPRQCKPGFNAGLLLRYMLEKCQDVSEAVSCLYHLPIASAQTFTMADTTEKNALVECNGEHVQCTNSLSGTSSFVCATNTFHLEEMAEYNSPEIDDWFAQTWYETLLSAFCEKGENFNLPSAERLLSGDYGFLCQYDRKTGKDTVWSVIYDLKRHKIHRCEGNPGRRRFKEDPRFSF